MCTALQELPMSAPASKLAAQRSLNGELKMSTSKYSPEENLE